MELLWECCGDGNISQNTEMNGIYGNAAGLQESIKRSAELLRC